MSHTDLAPSIRPARAIAAELPISRAPVPVPVPAVHCAACPCPEHCLPRGQSGGACGVRRTHLSGRRKVLAGQVLYGQGERLQFIYSVRCGTLKSTLTLSDGRAQVCSFHMAGEVIALDAVATGTHGTTVSALEDAQVCAIAYAPLIESSALDVPLQRRILSLMSQDIARGQRLTFLLGSFNAQERIAAFLLDLSQRFDALGYSAQEFSLRMTRAEIGSYLGLALETVSRTFAAFQEQGLIEVHNRRVRIADLTDFSRHFEALPQAR